MTDRLKTGDKLTVPVFTDICSAVCWGGNIGNIHDCPFNGKRRERVVLVVVVVTVVMGVVEYTRTDFTCYSCRLDGKGSAGSDTVDKALADKFLG